jgi:hypothetical protein
LEPVTTAGIVCPRYFATDNRIAQSADYGTPAHGNYCCSSLVDHMKTFVVTRFVADGQRSLRFFIWRSRFH